MKNKLLLILISFILISCASSKNQTETHLQEKESEITIKTDTTNKYRGKVEAVESNKQTESKLNFIIIPGKTGTILKNREFNFTDSRGNKMSGTLNPSDTLIFGSNTISREKYNSLKSEKETLQNRVDSLSVANSKQTEDVKSKSKRSSGNWKFWVGLIVGSLITLLIIYLIKKLWLRR